jgi:hypothetical protein
MNYWLGVVSKEHVMRGFSGGFAQVCHGKKGPLARMKKGDWLVYYSPGSRMGKSDLKAFTAIGRVADEDVFQFKMSPDFVPYRRKVDYLEIQEASIEVLKPDLELCQGSSWGYQLRRGLIEITKSDFDKIKKVMIK